MSKVEFLCNLVNQIPVHLIPIVDTSSCPLPDIYNLVLTLYIPRS